MRRFYEKTYNEVVLATDPIAHWTLGERFGATAYDATQNHFNGAITGATLGRPGIGDGLTGMFLDGINDFINIPFAIATPASVSIMLWVQMTAFDAFFRLVQRANTDGDGFSLRQGGPQRFIFQDKGFDIANNARTDANFVLNRWYCLVGIHDSVAPTLRIWQDGMIQSDSQVDDAGSGAGTDIDIGRRAEADQQYSECRVAHCALWNHALSPAEVQRLYRARWTR